MLRYVCNNYVLVILIIVLEETNFLELFSNSFQNLLEELKPVNHKYSIIIVILSLILSIVSLGLVIDLKNKVRHKRVVCNIFQMKIRCLFVLYVSQKIFFIGKCYKFVIFIF